MSDYSELKRLAESIHGKGTTVEMLNRWARFESACKPELILTLIADLEIAYKITDERDRLLKAIPACPIHGACVPYAIEWVEKAMLVMRELKSENNALLHRMSKGASDV